MFVIDVPYINLDQIYKSNQCPRWIKLKDMKYVIPFRDKALKVEQVKDRLIMGCTEEDFYNVWFRYLDLQTDYMAENIDIKKSHKKFKVPSNRGSGIHILNQDSFEAYVYSKLISFVGYEKASELMNRIAQTYGIEHVQSMREAGRIKWYEWPSPEVMLEKLNKEKVGTGKVKPFLKKLCSAIVNDDYAYTHNGNELFELFGRHSLDVFPTLCVEEAIEKNFKCDVDDFEDEYLSDMRLSNYGLLYLYILYHIKNQPSEVTNVGIGR